MQSAITVTRPPRWPQVVGVRLHPTSPPLPPQLNANSSLPTSSFSKLQQDQWSKGHITQLIFASPLVIGMTLRTGIQCHCPNGSEQSSSCWWATYLPLRVTTVSIARDFLREILIRYTDDLPNIIPGSEIYTLQHFIGRESLWSIANGVEGVQSSIIVQLIQWATSNLGIWLLCGHLAEMGTEQADSGHQAISTMILQVPATTLRWTKKWNQEKRKRNTMMFQKNTFKNQFKAEPTKH